MRLVHIVIRLVYGFAVVSTAFIPFGVYHSRVEPFITGWLFGFHLPVGLIALMLGIVSISFPNTILARKSNFGSLMLVIGILLATFAILCPPVYSINIIHNTNLVSSEIDIDYQIGNSTTSFISILSIITGLMIQKAVRSRIGV